MTSEPLPSLPAYQTAVVAKGPGTLTINEYAHMPPLSPDMAIVKTSAVAINPADAKMLDFSAAPGAIHGYDFAGTIVALGVDALASGRIAVGDRVAGFVHGMNSLKPDVGAFAQYVGACADLLLKIPQHMSFEDAATLGVGLGTAALGLFKELRVPASTEQLRERAKGLGADDPSAQDRKFVLVAGGSTATGTRALQLLKLAGLRAITTCSPSNSDLALRFGAEKVFDYQSQTCAADIRTYTKGRLAYALDCVSLADTTDLCYKAIGRPGGRYVSLEPFRTTVVEARPTIEPSWLMVLSLFGGQVALKGEYGREARPEDRRFGAEIFAAFQELLDCGLVDTHPTKVMPGGWEGVIDGVNEIRKGEISGYKLVYPVS